jgi:hypothetical protein
MTRRYLIVEERKEPSGWWIVLAAAIFIAFWKVMLVVIIIAGLVWLISKKRKEQSDHKQVNDAWLSMQADHQNMLAAYGDPVGTYGQYDAYTMPLTRPYPYDDITFNYDYDDGMRDWK